MIVTLVTLQQANRTESSPERKANKSGNWHAKCKTNQSKRFKSFVQRRFRCLFIDAVVV